jgi:hypothetical protein
LLEEKRGLYDSALSPSPPPPPSPEEEGIMEGQQQQDGASQRSNFNDKTAVKLEKAPGGRSDAEKKPLGNSGFEKEGQCLPLQRCTESEFVYITSI